MTQKTRPKAYPDFPDELPPKAAKADRDGYRDSVALMRQIKDPALAAEAATAICRNVNECRVPRRFAEDLWHRLILWNLDHRDAQGQERRFACLNCGQWRDGSFEGEGVVTRHAEVVTIEADHASGPRVVIEPVGCSHADFLLVCQTCGHAHEGFVPMVDSSSDGTSQQPKNEAKFNIN